MIAYYSYCLWVFWLVLGLINCTAATVGSKEMGHAAAALWGWNINVGLCQKMALEQSWHAVNYSFTVNIFKKYINKFYVKVRIRMPNYLQQINDSLKVLLKIIVSGWHTNSETILWNCSVWPLDVLEDF